MKEDLGLDGNELNYFDSLFRIGYAMSIIPSMLLLATYRPSVLLPSLELLWGAMTSLIAVADSPRLIYVARFVIGVCEASAYPGTVTILMNWYTSAELSTRVSIFSTSYPAANIFVGCMQAALWRGMDGTSGLRGWRWLFFLNGFMTIVVALAGYAVIPDSPNDSRAWWVGGARGRNIAKRRMTRAGKVVGSSGEVKTPADWLRLARTMTGRWKLWAFGGAYALWSWSQNVNMWYPLYLKSVLNSDGTKRFDVEEINLIPIAAYVLHAVAMLVFSRLSDRRQERCRWIVLQLGIHVFGCFVLVSSTSFAAQMAGWHLVFVSHSAGAILLAWMADAMRTKPEMRTLAVAVTITVVYLVDCWANLLLWPASEAPNYRYGYQFAGVFAVGSCFLAWWIRWKLSGKLV